MTSTHFGERIFPATAARAQRRRSGTVPVTPPPPKRELTSMKGAFLTSPSARS